MHNKGSNNTVTMEEAMVPSSAHFLECNTNVAGSSDNMDKVILVSRPCHQQVCVTGGCTPLDQYDSKYPNKPNIGVTGGCTPVDQFGSKKLTKPNICVASCVLLSCLVCGLLVFYTLSTLADMEARLAFVEANLAACASKHAAGASARQQSIEQGHTKNNEIEESIKRERRTTTARQTPTFVHLVGKGPLDYSTMDGDNTVFKWKRHDLPRNLHGLDVLPNSEAVERVKVRSSGVYLVYAQVALHGRENLDAHYHCSHRTVHKRGSGSWATILKSVLTQDNLGMEYQNFFADLNFKPLDSQLHMGVFHLLANDELSVQVSGHCTNDYSLTPENAYFGVVKLFNWG
jgi:hypothetical protein